MSNTRSIYACGLVLLLCGGVAEARRCTSPPPNPPNVVLSQVSATQWNVRVLDYSTFGTAPGQFCSCALNHTGLNILSVDSADFVLAGTSTSIGMVFAQDATATSQFSALQPGGTWQAFLSASPVVQPGISLDVIFSVTTTLNASFSQLQSNLAGGFIGTDEATSSGVLVGSHLAIVAPGNITGGGGGGGSVPSLSPLMLALLASLMVGLGIFYMRTR